MADYNINAVTRRVVYSGSAGLGPYAFSFEILDQNDIAAYFNSTKLTLTTDYTVTINANGTGSITIVTGTNVPSTPTGSDTIIIVGARDIERTTDFVTAGDLRASALNEQLDGLTIFDQQLAEENKRAMRAPVFDPALVEDGGVVDMTLPAKASRAGKTLAFDSDGNPVVGEDIGNWRGDWAASTSYTVRDLVRDASNYNVYRCNTAHTSSGSTPISSNADSAKWDLVIDASYAATQATNAAASASAAATSATNAATSATNAATSETNAAASASTASTAASNASTSETNAATSASNASTSETNAAASATSAASSATTATTQASAASTSASNAATSETNAATSASSASTSATTATTKASEASTSASNAATSETNAASSATAAAAAQAAAELAADNFDDTYLGAKASDPTVDNDGDALSAGDLYFNTATNVLKVYNGSAWQVAAVSAAGLLATSGGTMTGDINYGDNVKAIFGSAADGIQIYNTAAGDKFISEAGSGNLKIQGDNLYLQNSGGTENHIIAISDAAVTLHYDNAAKLATTSGGIDVTGGVTFDGGTTSADLNFDDNAKAVFGGGSDLKIYHDGLNSYIQDSGTGDLKIYAANFGMWNATGASNYMTATDGGAVTLAHAGTTKLATTSTGISVTGTAVATTDTDTTNTGNVTLDFGVNQNFVLTLTGNVTLDNPSTEAVGQSGFIVFIQDATGGRTVSLGTDYETAGGSGLTLSSAASSTDIVPYVVAASGRILLGAPQLNFS